jgi:hypothetical protein
MDGSHMKHGFYATTKRREQGNTDQSTSAILEKI